MNDMEQVAATLGRQRPFAAQQLGDMPVQVVYETIVELRLTTAVAFARSRKLHGRIERKLFWE